MGVQEAIKELNDLYVRANRDLFEDQLPHAEITIQSKGRKNAVGWFTTDKVWKNGETRYHEINLSAEHLDRSFEEIASTLIHEMVHLANSGEAIKDVSGSNGYHNKRFMVRAEGVGLIVEKGKHGFAYTSLGDNLKNWLGRQGADPEAFNTFRLRQETKQKKPTKMQKYYCGCTILRCATELDASCNLCGEPFVLED